jgi:Protein kinase domain
MCPVLRCRALRSLFVIHLAHCCSSPSLLVICLQEYCNGGSLRQALLEGRLSSSRMPQRWNCVTQLLTDIADGMAYIHGKRICHGDLNPSNILLKVLVEWNCMALASAPLTAVLSTIGILLKDAAKIIQIRQILIEPLHLAVVAQTAQLSLRNQVSLRIAGQKRLSKHPSCLQQNNMCEGAWQHG